ncbi:MAG: RsmG family class I SAM-dependent methyltransferase [Acidimicrobiia bacterium]
MSGASLLEVLATGRERGFVGPTPFEDQVAHAEGFVAALEGVVGRVVDLGSGGGLPGLVVAVRRPDLDVVLVDAVERRCTFLAEAIERLGLIRASTWHGRAEDLGRGPLRGSAGAVTARSFGPPAATAECAAPLLQVGGVLVVSEPPDERERWPGEGLALLGLEPRSTVAEPFHYRVLVQRELCPERFPRRPGLPFRRPLF